MIHLWKRLSNLWAWGSLDPYEMKEVVGKGSAAVEAVNEAFIYPKATIIPYKPRDPVKEFVGDESAIINNE